MRALCGSWNKFSIRDADSRMLVWGTFREIFDRIVIMISKKPTLDITHPNLAAQWHTDNDKRPEDVTAGSGYRAKWECTTHTHVWESTVCNRAKNGSGCPVCANKVVVAGINDLATLRPDRAAEWHPDNDKRADEVSVGAGYRAKWLCGKGHEWETSVCNRTTESVNSECPVCSNKKVVPGVNDIATTHPDLVPEWSKANKLLPTQVCSGSNKRVAWECANGHVWKTTVYSRAVEGTNCAKCIGRVTDIGVNDFETLHPDIAAQWDPSNPKPPSEYRPGSSQNVGWICDKGHSWKADICTRVLQKTGCPVCANKVVVAGFNDFASKRPVEASEWSVNNDRRATEVVCGSEYLATWKCSKGHVWMESVKSRSRGTKCQECAGSPDSYDIPNTNTGFEGRVFLTDTEHATYLKRMPVRYPRKGMRPTNGTCDVCGEPEEPDNKLQVAHKVPFGKGVSIYKLTPEWLDGDHNLVWAHTRKCNKSAELSHNEIIQLLSNVKD